MLTLGIVLGAVLLSLAPQGTSDLGQPPYLRVRYPIHGLNFEQGDLDGDGDVDLLACNVNDLVVLWNSGSGWIERTQSLGVPAEIAAIGDLDGDGDGDLVAEFEDELHVLLGDGQGAFSTLGPLRLADPATDVLLGDLDGDGDLDVVVVSHDEAQPDQGSLQVLLGDGQGGFTGGSFTSLAGPADAGALGDLDEDGWLDLVVDPQQQVFLGDGQGGFVAGGALNAFGYANRDCRPHLADLDGDLHLDVLTADYYGGMILLLGDGQGSFSTGTGYPAGIGPDLAIGDVDGDGDLDVAYKSGLGQNLGILLNDGTGVLIDQPERLHLVGTGAGLAELVLADLDGDGDQDLVSGGFEGLLILPGDGAGWFVLPQQLPAVEAAYVETADLDGDGQQDVVCSEGGLTSFLGDGQGGFGAPLVTAVPPVGKLALGDLNEDGILDVATSYALGALVCFGDGTGRFPQEVRPLGDHDLRSAALADLNGDGHLDVAYGTESALTGVGIRLLLGDGSGGFAQSDLQGSGTPDVLALGDVDGDKDIDILCGEHGQLVVYLGDGQGGFAVPVVHPVQYWMSGVAIADLDQDGWPDLLAGQYWSSGVWVLWGEPDGGHALPVVLESSEGLVAPHDFELADVDGDGVAELVVAYEGFSAGSYPGGVAVLRHQAPRELTWSWSFGHGDGPWSVAVGDLDLDGRLDLVTGSNQIINDPYGGSYDDPGPVEVLLNQLPPEAPCTSEVRYCVAKLNSAGCLPRICSSGTPTLSGPDDFIVSAERVMSHRPGLMIWGFAPGSLPFQDGTLCISGAITRTTLQSSGGTTGLYDCSGTYAYPFTQAYMVSKGLTAGTQVFAQYWSRDVGLPPPQVLSGLTDALSFTILP